jgi:hypothetical protein
MNEIVAKMDPVPNSRPAPPKTVEPTGEPRSFRQLTPIQQVASSILNLRVSEFRTVCSELHAESHSVGSSPHEIGDTLYEWSTRTLDGIKILPEVNR